MTIKKSVPAWCIHAVAGARYGAAAMLENASGKERDARRQMCQPVMLHRENGTALRKNSG